jgi:hypothetical protein
MRRKTLNNRGFAPLVLLVAIAAVLIVGGGGVYVYHQNHKPKAPASSTTGKTSSQTHNNTSTTSTVSANDLLSVAKQVYYQVAAYGSNPESAGSCGAQTYGNCPFTTDLATKISNPPGVDPANVLTLSAGAQNGLFGTLTYSDVTSTTDGGTVTINLAADSSAGGPNLTWKLTMVKNDGKLLVNNIQYTRSAADGSSACGPIEVYDYTSCPT